MENLTSGVRIHGVCKNDYSMDSTREICSPNAAVGCISLDFTGFYTQIHWISNEVGSIRQFIIWRYLAVIILVLAGFLR